MKALLLIVCLFLTAKTIIGHRFGLSLKCESATKAERHYQVVWAVALGAIAIVCMARL
jgi:hypothetical protein